MEYFEQKQNNLVRKNGSKNPYQKLLMQAMAAARRVKMALMLENIFDILTPLGHDFFIRKLFSENRSKHTSSPLSGTGSIKKCPQIKLSPGT